MLSISCTLVTAGKVGDDTFVASSVNAKILPFIPAAYSRPSGPSAIVVGLASAGTATAVDVGVVPPTTIVFRAKPAFIGCIVTGGGTSTPVVATLSYCAFVNTDTLWLVVAIPMKTMFGIALLVVPTVDQFDPLGETSAVSVDPLRASFSQTGNDTVALAIVDVMPPVASRCMNSIRPLGSTSRMTSREPAASDSRYMTPAFVCTSMFWRLVTRATIELSP